MAWLWDMSHGVSWPTGLSSLTWEMTSYSLDEYWTHHYWHFTLKSVCHLPFTATFAYMCEWERLSVRLCWTCMVYAHEDGCTDFHSFSVLCYWHKLFCSPCLNLFGFQSLFFLPWTQDISIQTYSVIHRFLFGFNSLTTLDFFLAIYSN